MNEQISFDQLMKSAANAAWDQRWDDAATFYMDAVKLDPVNTQALAGLGLSMMKKGNLQDAMKAYLRVSKLIPNDPLAHEKLAEIYKRTGFNKEASQRHLAVGEIYNSRGDVKHAIPHWEQAALLNSDLLQPHIRLGSLYEKDKEKLDLAAYAYMTMAYLLQKAGKDEHAEQALVHAQELLPISIEIRDALAILKNGGQIPKPMNTAYPPRTTTQSTDDLFETPGEQAEVTQLTPIEHATKNAMERLAEVVFAEDLNETLQVLILDGIESHQLGDDNTAIKVYEDARNDNFNNDALIYLLGSLYAKTGSSSKAMKTLEKCKDCIEYQLAINLITGKIHLENEKYRQACQDLLKALKAADEELNTGEIDVGGYERLQNSLSGQPKEHLTDIARTLAYYLSMPSWETSLRESIDNYIEKGKVSYATDLVEMIMEGGRPEIAELMQIIDLYIQREMYLMAREETQHAIELLPDYLPAHTRLADILITEGRLQEAAAKINLVATTYQMRGNEDKAADLFARVIDIWPADMAARAKVIEMLRAQKRYAEAVKQYIDMAEIYQNRLADTEKAQKVYEDALEYARQTDVENAYLIQILKAMADIELQHLNWQKAVTYLEKILETSPGDMTTANQTIDLYFQLNEPSRAIRTLDDYLRHCVVNGKISLVTDTLQNQVRRHPQETALRKRLVDVYIQQKRKTEAINQLNDLGEMYLDAGKMKEAKEAIQKLISLDPPDVEKYKLLLQQI